MPAPVPVLSPAPGPWSLPAHAWLRGLADLIHPPACAACAADLARGDTPICRTCDAALTPRRLPALPWLDARVALTSYEGALRTAIHRLKYEGEAWRGRPLGRVLSRGYPLLELEGEPILVPAPLSSRRLRERGYNQSALLARGLRREIGGTIAWDMLERTRDTGTQAGRSRARRREVRNDYRATRGVAGTVVILDDVTTTGETLIACAKALRGAGAEAVFALCLAWADRMDGR